MGKRKKYTAIFSCLVLVVALGAGIAGSMSAKKENERIKAQNEAALLEAENQTQMVDVNKNANPNGVDYKNPDDASNVKNYYEDLDKVSDDGAEDPDKSESESKSSENTNSADDKKQNKDTTNKADETNKTESTNNESAYADMDNEEFALADTPDAKPVFNWPLEGDIVMDFSSDALVYDATLEQYRTNDCICISASQGTPVKAAADGTVESVSYDDENGYTVTVFHSNGWRTTYGQLNEDTAVSQGDIVKAGDIIGTIAPPTKYSVALGDHLSFAVLENDTAIDPKVALAQ